jgi:hypothetical protein
MHGADYICKKPFESPPTQLAMNQAAGVGPSITEARCLTVVAFGVTMQNQNKFLHPRPLCDLHQCTTRFTRALDKHSKNLSLTYNIGSTVTAAAQARDTYTHTHKVMARLEHRLLLQAAVHFQHTHTKQQQQTRPPSLARSLSLSLFLSYIHSLL